MLQKGLFSQIGLGQATRHLPAVEQAIVETLQSCDPSLREPALRILMSGGKRLRPAFTIVAAQGLGVRITTPVIQVAAAIEILHVASLIHDDIIDQSPLRRNVETVYAHEGVDQAILVGDYLISCGLKLAIEANQHAGSILAQAFAKMCEGQSQETLATFQLKRSVDQYLLSIRKKSGVMFGAACAAGAACAGASKQDVQALAAYGELFGTSFQIIDDLLDLYAKTDQLGKTAGNDIKEGVYTLPVLLSMQQDPDKTIHLIKQADIPHLQQLLVANGATKQSCEQIAEFNRHAVDNLLVCAGAFTTTLAITPHHYQRLAFKKLPAQFRAE